MGERPKLLDLFCGAGGCAMGYHRAGFDVVGVDARPQPRYPFTFVQADALGWLSQRLIAYRYDGCGFPYSVIHASPPCQRYTRLSAIHGKSQHPDLLARTREALQWAREETGCHWAIENVCGAPMSPFAVTLCGLMFGLRVVRHRLFESSLLLFAPPHPPHGRGGRFTQRRGVYDRGERGLVTVAGNNFCPAVAREAMGIDWMTGRELSQAIPPAFTEFVGRQLAAASP